MKAYLSIAISLLAMIISMISVIVSAHVTGWHTQEYLLVTLVGVVIIAVLAALVFRRND